MSHQDYLMLKPLQIRTLTNQRVGCDQVSCSEEGQYFAASVARDRKEGRRNVEQSHQIGLKQKE